VPTGTSGMHAIDIVSDANVAFKWFHSEGEEEVAAARQLLAAHASRQLSIAVLDLTTYEIGNALIRRSGAAAAERTTTVLEALAEICPVLQPEAGELRLAATLAERHGLTFYDGVYAAVATWRGAQLATFDAALLEAGLGSRPGALA
jgi:predicted nucleic acid-binding protein